MCVVDDAGNPTATFQWYDHEDTLIPGEGETGRLDVTFDTLCEAGNYSCVPYNSVGPGPGAVINLTITGRLINISYIICVQVPGY